ncbi:MULTISPECIES: class F sortase [Streptomyces]
MGRPVSRRLLLAALAVALVSLVAATVWTVSAWPSTPDKPEDFGTGFHDGTGAKSPPAGNASSPPVSSPGEASRPSPDATPTPAQPPAPVTVSLPRLKVQAPVDAVGVTDSGQMQVPRDPRRVGWYRFSPAPGSSAGSAVLVGHLDSTDRGLGVLAALNEVRQGDTVRLTRSTGKDLLYRIVARRTVDKSGLGAAGVFRRQGPPVLTLITCTGPFRPDAGGYQQNLVVTAQQVSS